MATKHHPKPQDIICGRDKSAYAHPGNEQFRRLVQSFREKYQNTKQRNEKAAITQDILYQIQREGGEFLKRDDATGAWVTLPEPEAYEKVSHALRSCKKKTTTTTKIIGTRPKPLAKTCAPRIEPPQLYSDTSNELFSNVLSRQRQILVDTVACCSFFKDGEEDEITASTSYDSTTAADGSIFDVVVGDFHVEDEEDCVPTPVGLTLTYTNSDAAFFAGAFPW